MKPFVFSATALLLSGTLWITHLPSTTPINGSFIVMCASLGALIKSLHTVEVRS